MIGRRRARPLLAVLAILKVWAARTSFTESRGAASDSWAALSCNGAPERELSA